MIVLAIIAWLLVGYAGFVWWWTASNSLTAGDALFGLEVAWLGPIAWLIGWHIHRELMRYPRSRGSSTGRVLVRCRWRP